MRASFIDIFAAFERGNSSEDVDVNSDEVQSIRDLGRTSKSVEALTSQMNEVAVSSKPIDMNPPVVSVDGSCPGDAVQDIDKKIRALKKKVQRLNPSHIRLAEAQQQKKATEKMRAEELEKIRKLEGWREELKLLESKKI
ncbi:Partner of Y14 and mago [Linum perenne]